jgi:hypothetical protein
VASETNETAKDNAETTSIKNREDFVHESETRGTNLWVKTILSVARKVRTLDDSGRRTAKFKISIWNLFTSSAAAGLILSAI